MAHQRPVEGKLVEHHVLVGGGHARTLGRHCAIAGVEVYGSLLCWLVGRSLLCFLGLHRAVPRGALRLLAPFAQIVLLASAMQAFRNLDQALSRGVHGVPLLKQTALRQDLWVLYLRLYLRIKGPLVRFRANLGQ